MIGRQIKKLNFKLMKTKMESYSGTTNKPIISNAFSLDQQFFGTKNTTVHAKTNGKSGITDFARVPMPHSMPGQVKKTKDVPTEKKHKKEARHKTRTNWITMDS